MSARASKTKFLLRLTFGTASALVVAGGCANIIGTSDLEPDDEASGGALVGGKGGSGGSGGDTSKGGSSGKGGGTSDGGASGGAPPMMGGAVDCNGDPLEINEELVRGCLLYESCYTPSVSITTCVTYNMPAVFSGRACAQGATSCNDIVTCRHAAYMHPDGPVSCDDAAGGAPGEGACVDNYAVNCENANIPQYTDCNAEGGTCRKQSDGWAACEVVPTCTEDDLGTGCSGEIWYYCWEGVGYGTDCEASAASCEAYEDPATPGATSYDCFYATTSCGADSATCNGDNAILCSGGTRYQYACGVSNLSCDDSTADLYCLAPGCSTADADNCSESCNGSELTFCIGGTPVTVDCQDYGFDTCRETTLDTFAIAVCANSF